MRPPRSRLANILILVAVLGTFLFLVYQFLVGPGPRVDADVIDFSTTVEEIQELSTVKSHVRFAVIVREEGGNVLVRRLADQSDGVGMDNLSSLLFEDPTMIVELHGVATYGVRLGDLDKRATQSDTTVVFNLPAAEVLDVKLVAADTRIVARMKGFFRSSNSLLLNEANVKGESFVMEMAQRDTTLLQVASDRTRDLLALLVERAGRRAIFR